MIDGPDSLLEDVVVDEMVRESPELESPRVRNAVSTMPPNPATARAGIVRVGAAAVLAVADWLRPRPRSALLSASSLRDGRCVSIERLRSVGYRSNDRSSSEHRARLPSTLTDALVGAAAGTYARMGSGGGVGVSCGRVAHSTPAAKGCAEPVPPDLKLAPRRRVCDGVNVVGEKCNSASASERGEDGSERIVDVDVARWV